MRKLAIAPGIIIAGLLAFAHPALADVVIPPSVPDIGGLFGIAAIAVVVAVAAVILIFRRKR